MNKYCQFVTVVWPDRRDGSSLISLSHLWFPIQFSLPSLSFSVIYIFLAFFFFFLFSPLSINTRISVLLKRTSPLFLLSLRALFFLHILSHIDPSSLCYLIAITTSNRYKFQVQGSLHLSSSFPFKRIIP